MTRATNGNNLLDVQNLQVLFSRASQGLRYAGPAFRAVDDVSFSLSRNTTLGIVGESGSGKTTLARAILKLINAAGGRVIFDGRDVFSLKGSDLRRLRRDMQIVFQDPVGSLNPKMTVERLIAEPLEIHGIATGAPARRRVAELLDRVGLQPEFMRRYPYEFSGGQRQRIGIARALAASPRLLICDEPVSALDVSVQSQIINLLADLRRDLGLTCILIAHNLAVVRHLCENVAVMFRGQFVEYGPTDAVFENPRHPYTRTLLAAVPTLDPSRRASVDIATRVSPPRSPLVETSLPNYPDARCMYYPRCPYAEERCRVERPLLAPHQCTKTSQFVACHLTDAI